MILSECIANVLDLISEDTLILLWVCSGKIGLVATGPKPEALVVALVRTAIVDLNGSGLAMVVGATIAFVDVGSKVDFCKRSDDFVASTVLQHLLLVDVGSGPLVAVTKGTSV